MSFSDDGPDDRVDFGIRGQTTDTDDQRKFFLAGGEANAGLPAKGVEYRPYWQKRYDTAIAAVLRLRQSDPYGGYR